MSLFLKYNTFYLLAEITLKLYFNRLKNTSHILLMFFYYYVRRSVLFKIHAANIEASKIFVLFWSVTMENYC